jgi:Tfp pilus assembly protein PilE
MSKAQAERIAAKAATDGNKHVINSYYYLAKAAFKQESDLTASTSLVKDEDACYKDLG